MLLRILLLAALGVVVYLLVRRFLAQRRTHPDRSFAPMVRCARCGLHLPSTEAVMVQGQLYCSQEHARLGTGS